MVVTTLIPAFRKQRQVDLCAIKTTQVYIVSSRAASAVQREPVSKKPNKQQQKPKQTMRKRKRTLLLFGED